MMTFATKNCEFIQVMIVIVVYAVSRNNGICYFNGGIEEEWKLTSDIQNLPIPNMEQFMKKGGRIGESRNSYPRNINMIYADR